LDNISQGFSTHRKQRILSVLETGILKDEIHKYINNYPQKIRVLGYKNEETLSKFKNNLNNNSIGDNKIICQ
jgi:predicted nucleotidyltransferase